jgi:hypothetical protein
LLGVALNTPIRSLAVDTFGGVVLLMCTSTPNLTLVSFATAVLLDTTNIISCPAGSVLLFYY